MTREDICNIEPVSDDALTGAVRLLELLDDVDADARWTLVEGGESCPK